MNTEVNIEIQRLLLEKGIDTPVKTTIADVVMVLYKNYGIWISVQPNEPYSDNDWCFILYRDNQRCEALEGYNSPTEAYSEAILFALKKLI